MPSPQPDDAAPGEPRASREFPIAGPQGRTILLPEGEEALRSLRAALSANDPELQVAAARELRAHAGAAVPPLCDALSDPHAEVRRAAAESLGEIADPRAIGPLTAALRQSLVGGSGRRQLWAGLLLVFVIILLITGYFWGMIAWHIGGAFFGMFNIWIQAGKRVSSRMSGQRSARSQVCRAISEALIRIAERHPSPQLRELLPELRALSADRIHQDQSARQASRAAAQRIDALTEALKNLPITSHASVPDPASLPVIAEQPRNPEQELRGNN